MFIGHFGLGLASKRVASTVSLGVLVTAAQFPDLLWPVFLLLGVEQVAVTGGTISLAFEHYPYSHSLLFALVWGGLAGGAFYALRSDRTGAAVVGGLVVSHWLLDLLVHVPDLPLYPGGPLVGFGLWKWPLVALALEFAILAAGAGLYVRFSEPIGRSGAYGLVAFLGILGTIQLGNAFGPPPESATMVAIVGLSQWLLVGLAFWTDARRRVQPVPTGR